MPKGVKLSKKQNGFVEEYVRTGNGVQSALNNYGTEDYNSANQIAIENLQKPTIQNAIKSIVDRIPDELLYKTHIEGLKAKRIELAQEVPDHAVRHKYLDTAYKLKNLYPKESNTTAIQINVNSDREKYK